jgi:hypothetical protein
MALADMQPIVEKIRKELVAPSYYFDVKYNIRSKTRWKIASDVIEFFAQILVGASTILAFSAGYFDDKILSFIAGAIGTLALVMLRFAVYAMNESKERTIQVNKLLEKLGIEKIPDITSDTNNCVFDKLNIKSNSDTNIDLSDNSADKPDYSESKPSDNDQHVITCNV